MPNNRIAVLYAADGTPIDVWKWDDTEKYVWGKPDVDMNEMTAGEYIHHYDRRLTNSEIQAMQKAAEDKLVKDRLEAARQLLIAAGEIPDPNAPTSEADVSAGDGINV